MLIYTKIVDSVKKIFGTEGHIPSSSDVELTYVDSDSSEIEPVPGDTYLDNGHGGIVRKSDGKDVNVFIGDVQIIGDAPTASHDLDEE